MQSPFKNETSKKEQNLLSVHIYHGLHLPEF